MNGISIKLNLLNLQTSVVKMKGKSGQLECLVIPIALNNLFKGEKGVYLDCTAFELKNKRADSKDTHLIKQSLPKEIYEEMTEEERRAIPILGNAILWSGVTESDPQSSATAIEEDDGLPF